MARPHSCVSLRLTAACLVMCARAALAAEFDGVVSVKLESAEGTTEYRAGLVVGKLPGPVAVSAVLLPKTALYSSDLEPVRSVESARGGGGQILNIPTVEIPVAKLGLHSLSMVAVGRAPRVGVAACMGSIGSGQAVRVVTAAQGSGELRSISGRIVESTNLKNFIELNLTGAPPRPGDPVFVAAPQSPEWRVWGLVYMVLGLNRIRVLTLPQIFAGLPPESGTWGLQPLGLCDLRERYPSVGFSNELGELMEGSLEAMSRPYESDRSKVMREAWPTIRTYLNRPGIEHYFYRSLLNDEEQFAQFWQSIVALASERGAQLQSPLAATSPVARLQTHLPGGGIERGWAVAVAYTEGTILLLTAHHLVKPGLRGEREIQVYLPALQGYGLEARRIPFVDESLDLAVIEVEAPEELRAKVFSIYRVACPDTPLGAVQVPVNAWGWRRERLNGSVKPHLTPGSLWVTGVDVTRGFSGGAVLKNGNQIAGILTKDLGRGGGSLAVSIQAGLRLVQFGELGLARAPCKPVTYEEQVRYQVFQSLAGRGRIPTPNAQVLAALFTPADAARIRAAELPDMRETLRGQAGEEFSDIKDDAIFEAMAGEFVANTVTRCSTLTGQSMEPSSQEFLDRTSPTVDGRPTIRREDTIGCDLPRSGPQRLALRRGLKVRLCRIHGRAGRSGYGSTLVHEGRLWDATFLRKCEKLEVEWYVPSGWIGKMAAREPTSPELVRIPAGPFRMGGCKEDAPPGYRRIVECDGRAPVVATFEATTPAFRISRFPVTVAEYARCIHAGKCVYQVPESDLGKHAKSPCNWGRSGRARHPMNCIAWADATEYCSAMGGQLPTEEEWEKAARGTDARPFPWGQEDELGMHRLREVLRGTMEVGLAPDLASPYGVEDMALQVLEWTSELYEPYTPGWTGEYMLGEDYPLYRVLRGISGRTFHRRAWPAKKANKYIGFRCVFPD